jgi:hypothetical protein
MGLHVIKKFCTSKEIVSKPKRLPTEWGKKTLFASYTCDKELITKIYRELKI